MKIVYNDIYNRIKRTDYPVFFIISENKKGFYAISGCREVIASYICRYFYTIKNRTKILIGINCFKQDNEAAIFAISSILKECSKLCRIKTPEIRKLTISYPYYKDTYGIVFVFESKWLCHPALISFALLIARFFVFRKDMAIKNIEYTNMEEYLMNIIKYSDRTSYYEIISDIEYISFISKYIRLVFLNLKFLFNNNNYYIKNFNQHDGISNLCQHVTSNENINEKMREVIRRNKKISN